MIVVIPAYQPDNKLIRLVKELLAETDYSIVIVDDGSSADKQSIFDEIERIKSSTLTILHHEVNKGKGRAMKTAFEWIHEHAFKDEGIITVDADGQHLIKDIIRVSENWTSNKQALVLGSRRFTGKVPFRSRFGNGITRTVFAVSTGVRVYDTQTGLRAFSTEFLDEMIKIDGERYEYEINQLLVCTKKHIPIVETTIDTVYINDNATSHFNAIRDSWRIYKMILAFVASSFISWIVDYLLLLLLTAVFSSLTNGEGFSILGFIAQPKLPALIIARIVSTIINYRLNQRMVFETKSKGSIFRYYVLAAASLTINYGMLHVLSPAIMPLYIAQILAQIMLYPLNFILQKKFVFREKN